MLIKYIKSVLWRVAKRLSYIEEAQCLKVNKPLLLHLVDCLYYLYQWCTVKQISDNEIYLLIKYIKSILWRVVKRLSYTEDARYLKVNLLLISSWWTSDLLQFLDTSYNTENFAACITLHILLSTKLQNNAVAIKMFMLWLLLLLVFSSYKQGESFRTGISSSNLLQSEKSVTTQNVERNLNSIQLNPQVHEFEWFTKFERRKKTVNIRKDAKHQNVL